MLPGVCSLAVHGERCQAAAWHALGREGAAPRLQHELQLAHCRELIAALVAVQDPGHALKQHMLYVTSLAGALQALMATDPAVAVPLALEAPGHGDSGDRASRHQAGSSNRGGRGRGSAIVDSYLGAVAGCAALVCGKARGSSGSPAALAVAAQRGKAALKGLLLIAEEATEAVMDIIKGNRYGKRGGSAVLSEAVVQLLEPPSGQQRLHSGGGIVGSSGGAVTYKGDPAVSRTLACQLLDILLDIDPWLQEAVVKDTKLLAALAAQLPPAPPAPPAPGHGPPPAGCCGGPRPAGGEEQQLDAARTAAGCIDTALRDNRGAVPALLCASPGIVAGLVALLRWRPDNCQVVHRCIARADLDSSRPRLGAGSRHRLPVGG